MKLTHSARNLVLALVIGAAAIGIVSYSIWSFQEQIRDLKVPPPLAHNEKEGTPSNPVPIDNKGAEDKSDLIRVDYPKPGDVISSPLVVKGEASGSWYFEASFPVVLEDGNGKVLAEGHADAKGDWMTNDFVPFTATLKFTKPTSPTGTLILKKDNPSGLPEHDDELRVLVRFVPETAKACHPTGCSNQICADEDVITDCAMRPEYVCSKDAKCERQNDGKCGWTQTVDLIACLTTNGAVR